MVKALIDWFVLLVIFVVLWGTAYNFSRRTFRIVVLAAIVTAVGLITRLGLTTDHPGNYADAFLQGGNSIAWVMFTLLAHGNASKVIPLRRVGWIGLLILLGVVLAWFDTWSARREQPRVTVPDAPSPEPGNSHLEDRRMLTEKLQFSLPSVDVSRPTAMPGGTTTDSVASLAAGSAVVATALMQMLRSLQGHPRTFEVRMFIEGCKLSRHVQGSGGNRRVTVEVRDSRTGQSIGVKVFQPCRREEAAEMVAGYTARQVFRKDPSTPRWAVGSTDGEDLSAYLLARQTCPEERTYSAWRNCRQSRLGKLEQAARSNTGGTGVVGYELADICDLNGDNMRSLLMHLRNRVRCRQFWRGRCRLAISLGMLAEDQIFSQWLDAASKHSSKEHPQDCMKCNIIREMSNADMLHNLRNRNALCGECRTEEEKKKARLALLRLASKEFRACRRHSRAFVLLWTAFWYRRVRRESMTALHGKPQWWMHPRRRLWPVVFGLEIVEQRMCRLKDPPDVADEKLDKAQKRVRRRLRLGEALCAAPCPPPDRIRWRINIGKRNRPWDYRRAPWQAVYNAACLHALPNSSYSAPGGSWVKNAEIAVRLLQLAISDPDCELERPSEWIGTDPDLLSLQQFEGFGEFVRAQAKADFDPSSPGPNVGNKWFHEQLPIEDPRASASAAQRLSRPPSHRRSSYRRAIAGHTRCDRLHSGPEPPELGYLYAAVSHGGRRCQARRIGDL